VAQLPSRQPAELVRLGYVGRLTPVKGAHVLMQALATLVPDAPLEVHIYGDLEQEPNYAAELRRLAAGLPYVQFHGRFGRHELATVFGGLDALVVPSLWYENNPLVIQEAFAAGVPVIASRLGGMAEFVRDGVDGRLFEAGQSAGLAAVLSEMIAQPAQLEALRAHVPSVRTMADEMATLSEIYSRVTRAPAPAGAAQPA
jgi:glycosyltransferase involved in cell wall biosynthesis